MPTTRTPKKRRPRSSIAVQRAVPAAPSARLLRSYARSALGAASDVTLRVVGAAESRRLNYTYRRQNRATNVLSFSYRRRPLRGDIVLCHPLIASEARAQRKDLRAHYAHLVIHGVLHLRGLDHARRIDALRMERSEVRILRRLGFANPYAVK